MADVRKLSLWMDGLGWLLPSLMADASEDGAAPNTGNVPTMPGAQRMFADGQWYYVMPPANLAAMLRAAAGGQVAQEPSSAPADPTKPPMVTMHPMQMMQQMFQSKMLESMMQSMGMGQQQQETKPPLDLRQLTEPAMVFGEKLKEGIIGAMQVWRAVKG